MSGDDASVNAYIIERSVDAIDRNNREWKEVCDEWRALQAKTYRLCCELLVLSTALFIAALWGWLR